MTAGHLLEWIVGLLGSKIRGVLHIYIGGGRINKIEITKEVDLK